MDFSAFDRYQAQHKTRTSKRAGRNRGAKARQQQQLDRQIWLIHQQMVEKLLANPALLPPLQQQLEQTQQQGLLRHSEYLFWHCAFALYPDGPAFRAAILSIEPGPTKYRRRTRLQGLLSETERAALLQTLAATGTEPAVLAHAPEPPA